MTGVARRSSSSSTATRCRPRSRSTLKDPQDGARPSSTPIKANPTLREGRRAPGRSREVDSSTVSRSSTSSSRSRACVRIVELVFIVHARLVISLMLHRQHHPSRDLLAAQGDRHHAPRRRVATGSSARRSCWRACCRALIGALLAILTLARASSGSSCMPKIETVLQFLPLDAVRRGAARSSPRILLVSGIVIGLARLGDRAPALPEGLAPHRGRDPHESGTSHEIAAVKHRPRRARRRSSVVLAQRSWPAGSSSGRVTANAAALPTVVPRDRDGHRRV